MPKVNTYLSFDGSAAEAMRFYEGALDAKLDVSREVRRHARRQADAARRAPTR